MNTIFRITSALLILLTSIQFVFAQAPGSTSYQYNGYVGTLITNKTVYNDYRRLHECRFSDGPLNSAEVCQVKGVAVSTNGTIYFSDAGNGRVRYIDSKTSPYTIKTLVGGAEKTRIDGAKDIARFHSPEQLQIDAEGNLYVMDTRITIRKIATDGTVSTVFEIAKTNTIDGKEAKLKEVKNFALGPGNVIYCTLTRHHAVFKITGKQSLEVFCGDPKSKGDIDGDAKTARFDLPAYIGFKRNGDMLVIDHDNYMIKKIDPKGNAARIAGKKQGFMIEDNNGPALDSRIFYPHAVAEDAMGNLVFTQGQHLIKLIDAENKIVTIAGLTNQKYNEKLKVYVDGGFKDGGPTEAVFMMPELLTFDKSNRVIIIDGNGLRFLGVTDTRNKAAVNPGASADTLQQSASITKSSAKTVPGQPEFIAGDSHETGMRNGRGKGVVLGADIWGMKISPDKYIYLADRNNHLIRKVHVDGNVETFAGSYKGALNLMKFNKPGNKNGNRTDAMFFQPWDLVMDNTGNIFIADTYNHSIRKIDNDGTVSTFAGGGASGRDEGSYKDGTGEEARFNAPRAITIDKLGNLYVADEENSLIRKITPEREVTTLAGIASEKGSKYNATTGPKGVGRLVKPHGICDLNDSLLAITDSKNDYIWSVNKRTGELKILAGTNAKKYTAVDLEIFRDGSFSTSSFSSPATLALRKNGNLLVADRGNFRIRELNFQTKQVSTFHSNKPGHADVSANKSGGIELFIRAICVDDDDNVYFIEDKELKKISSK